jgi:hypothetical protein
MSTMMQNMFAGGQNPNANAGQNNPQNQQQAGADAAGAGANPLAEMLRAGESVILINY